MATKIVAIDIETAPTFDEDVIKRLASRIKAPANYKDEEKIERYKQEKLAEAVRETALNPTFGRVVAWAVYDGNDLFSLVEGSDEVGSLNALANAIRLAYDSKRREYGRYIVGHNILGFDLPFIIKRAAIVGANEIIELVRSGLLPKPIEPPWRIEHVVDTMLAWGKPYARLKDIASALGLLDGSEDEMDGGQTLDAYLNGNLDAVREHVENDVKITFVVAKRMRGVFW